MALSDLLKWFIMYIFLSGKVFSLRDSIEWDPQGIPISKDHLTNQCHQDINEIQDALNRGTQWALQLWNRNPNENQFNLITYGEKSICDIKEDGGKNITTTFYIATVKRTNNDEGRDFQKRLGICFPNSCTNLQIISLIHSGIRISPVKQQNESQISITELRGLHSNYSYFNDAVFIILMIVFMLLGLICFLSTCFHFYTERVDFKPRSSMTFRSHEVIIINDHIKRISSPFSVPFWHQIILCLSIKKNLLRLFQKDPKKNEEEIAPVHGIRVLSLLWTILTHLSIYFYNNSDIDDLLPKIIIISTYAADTFFFLSGFLLIYLYFDSKCKYCPTNKIYNIKENVLQWIGLLLYRIFRLLPAYLFVIGVVSVSMASLQTLSRLEGPYQESISCRLYWWRNALFINTFYSDINQTCMPWSSYLSTNTILYLISLILVIFAFRFKKSSLAIIMIILIVNWICNFYMKHNINGIINYQTDIFLFNGDAEPWTRIGSFLTGLLFGFLLHNRRIIMNKGLSIFFWLLTLIIVVCLIYGVTIYQYERSLLFVLFWSLKNTLWAMCIGWILLASAAGHGGIVCRMLSSRVFYPLSRLSYTTFLLHPILIRICFLSGEHLNLTKSLLIIYFFGCTVASYLFGLLLSIFIEMPVINLLRLGHPLKII